MGQLPVNSSKMCRPLFIFCGSQNSCPDAPVHKGDKWQFKDNCPINPAYDVLELDVRDYFSKAEKKELREILKKHPAEKTENLIPRLALICYREAVTKQPSLKDIRIAVDNSINILKRAVELTDILQSGQLSDYKNIPLFWTSQIGTGDSCIPQDGGLSYKESPLINDHALSVLDQAGQAREALLQLVDSLSKLKTDRTLPDANRPEADKHNIGFILAIEYYTILDTMPSTTIDGCYRQLLSFTLKKVGLSHKSPDRIIKQSLGRLKEHLHS